MNLTPDEVNRLNARQQDPQLHPLTCGNDRGNSAHKAYAAEYGGDWGQLVATSERRVCPVPGCGYMQEYGMPRTGLIDPLLARIAQLEAALKPFAEWAEWIDRTSPGFDGKAIVHGEGHPPLRTYRAAREALEGRG